MTNSCLYTGYVQHRRHTPVCNTFRYRLFLLYLDLDEVGQVFARRWFWSVRRPALARFRREDYLGPADVPLREAVRRRLAERDLTLNGPVRLLTHLRYFGYVANPVSFYFCFAADGQTLEHVLAEVTNTPWGERHCYVMSDGRQTAGGLEYEFDKALHVSPFMPMDMHYLWRFGVPGERLSVHNNLYRDGRKVFDATLTLRRQPLSAGVMARTLMLQPFMTLRVTALIYYQAAKIYLRRVPFVTHPDKTTSRNAAS